MKQHPFRWPALLLPLLLLGCDRGHATPQQAQDVVMEAPTPTWHDNKNLPIPQPTGEHEVGVRLREYVIELTRDTFPAGDITFHVLNAGTTAHDFVVRGNGAYGLTNHIAVGDSAQLQITLAPGEYEYLCGVRDEILHYAEGMIGKFVVQ
jgi:plastocyanin